MGRDEQAILERLGRDGLIRVIDDVLDQKRLVRVANATGLTYPGMRTRSQKRERVTADLADRAIAEPATLQELCRALRRATSASRKDYRALDDERAVARLTDERFLEANGHLGAALFLLADGSIQPDRGDLLDRLLAFRPAERARGQRGSPSHSGTGAGPKPADPRPPASAPDRSGKRLAELEKKCRHQEGQIGRLRESEKRLKHDLVERRGELAESRMLVGRLRQEIETLRDGAARVGDSTAVLEAIQEAVAPLVRSVKKLGTEQRKIAHELRKMRPADLGPAVEAIAERVEKLERAIEDARKESASVRRQSKRGTDGLGQRIEELGAEVRAVGERLDRVGAPGFPRSRTKGEAPRVGVFIDVQNVFYAARKLKGKLDFDALLEVAANDRRLILAQAYVVESKEIDQSGFIAMLQHRAIRVKRKTLKVRADGSMKGDWDMEMALDILEEAPRLDLVVLVSGDGDFTSLVTRVKSLGPRVEVFGFPRHTAKSLIEAADAFQALDRKFMIRSERPTGKRAAAADSDATS